MNNLFEIAVVTLSVFYLIQLGIFSVGWKFLFQKNNPPSSGQKKVTVIIPARNEERNIRLILTALLKQTYPAVLTEICVVDDHSSDATAAIVEQEFPDVLLIRMAGPESGGAYKKEAIAQAIKNSSGEIILTTDADCVPQPEWIEKMMDCFTDNETEMALGPVRLADSGFFLGRIQQLEFAALQGITAAAAALQNPLMCNGANLAYTRKIFERLNGFSGNEKIAGGDDMMLLQKINRNNPLSIRFVADEKAVVQTMPQTGLRSLMNQRKRWTSKTPFYPDLNIILILLLNYFYNLFLLLSILLACFHLFSPTLIFILIAAKLISETIFLVPVAGWFKIKNAALFFLPASLLYIPYVVFIGLAGLFGSFEWKNRTLRR